MRPGVLTICSFLNIVRLLLSLRGQTRNSRGGPEKNCTFVLFSPESEFSLDGQAKMHCATPRMFQEVTQLFKLILRAESQSVGRFFSYALSFSANGLLRSKEYYLWCSSGARQINIRLKNKCMFLNQFFACMFLNQFSALILKMAFECGFKIFLPANSLQIHSKV